MTIGCDGGGNLTNALIAELISPTPSSVASAGVAALASLGCEIIQ